MKKFLSLIILATIIATLMIGSLAVDYYGKVMPDHLFTADMVLLKSDAALLKKSLLYDDGRIYGGFTPNLSKEVPSDGAYAGVYFQDEVSASDYRYIKVGYKGYVENLQTAAAVDVNIGIDNVRFWGALPTATLDGTHREMIIDAATLTGGDAYNGSSNTGYGMIDDDALYSYVWFKPWGSHSHVDMCDGDYFRIEYVAFFGTLAEAEAYTTESYSWDVGDSTALLAVTSPYITSTEMSGEYRYDDSLPYMRYTQLTSIGNNAAENVAIDLGGLNSGNDKENVYFLMRYRSNIQNSDTIDLNLITSYGTGSARIWGPRINYIADGEYHDLIIDLSSFDYTGGNGGYYAPSDDETIWGLVNRVYKVRIKPYNQAKVLEGEYFDVAYYGLFESYDDARDIDPAEIFTSDMRGDVDGDFNVTSVDVIKLARALSDPSLTYNDETHNYDINGDEVISAADQVILARHMAKWRDYASLYTTVATSSYISELDDEFDEKKAAVLSSESEWEVGDGGTIYYVSPNGNDSNSGTSESSAWKTTANLKRSKLDYGDVVLFERGGIWHEKFSAVDGVTYSAYGSGAKPAFYGSVDASDPNSWELAYDNIWKFNARTFDITKSDVGLIIFDDGYAYGSRVLTDSNGIMQSVGMSGITSNGLETWYREGGSYADETTLSHDLEYFLSPDSGYVYVYSETNPALRFNSIELSTKGKVITATSFCTFDNLTVKYGSSHGIGMGTVQDVTVRNCEIGWIGGAIQNYSSDPTGRFGNGIEIYGSADGFYVHDNYVYECFDCGITVQIQGSISSGSYRYQLNCYFTDNVVERCNSPLESWITHPDEPDEDTFMYMNNVIYDNNLCRSSGYGFGGYIHTKTDNNMFYGGGRTYAVMTNCFIRNNKMWNIRNLVILAYPTSTNYGKGFIWTDNTIIKAYDSVFARIASDLASTDGNIETFPYNDKTLAMFERFKVLGRNNLLTVYD